LHVSRLYWNDAAARALSVDPRLHVALDGAHDDGTRTGALLAWLNELGAPASLDAVGSELDLREDAWRALGELIASHVARGGAWDWLRAEAPWRRDRVTLPTYRFHRVRFWRERMRGRDTSAPDVRLSLAWTPRAVPDADRAAQCVLCGASESWGEAFAAALRGVCDDVQWSRPDMAFARGAHVIWLAPSAPENIAEQLAALARIIAAARASDARLVVVTDRAQPDADDSPADDPMAASFAGLARVAFLEQPAIDGAIIDVDVRSAYALTLAARVAAGPLEGEQWRLRQGSTHVARLERARERTGGCRTSTALRPILSPAARAVWASRSLTGWSNAARSACCCCRAEARTGCLRRTQREWKRCAPQVPT
jgi:acyl transferase domain-containing protein